MSEVTDRITAGVSEAAGEPVPSLAGVAAAPVVRRPPAGAGLGPVGWARTNLFNSWLSFAITILLIYLIARWVLGFVNWAFVHAVWSVPANPAGGLDPTPCRDAQGVGACWAMIGDKYRFTLFGYYPYDEQWRPAIVVLLFLGLFAVSAMRRFWRKELIYIWGRDADGDRPADVGRLTRLG